MNTITIYSASAPIFTKIGPLLSHSKDQLAKFEGSFARDPTALYIKKRGVLMLAELGLSDQVGCNIRYYQIKADEESANSGVIFEFENEDLTPTLEKLAQDIRSHLDKLIEYSCETPMEIAPMQQQITFDSNDNSHEIISESEYNELDTKITFNSENHGKKSSTFINDVLETSEQNASDSLLPHHKVPPTLDQRIIREMMEDFKCNDLHLKDSLGIQRGTFKTPENDTQPEPLKCTAWITGIPTLSPLKIKIKFSIGKKSITQDLSVPVHSYGVLLTRLKSLSKPEKIECRATIEFDGKGKTYGLLDLEFPSTLRDTP